ncbi:MAG: hypothetical protein WC659_05295 [Patescibacteria group bacterium]
METKINWFSIGTLAVAIAAVAVGFWGPCSPSHSDLSAVRTAADASALAMVQANTETLRGELKSGLETQKKEFATRIERVEGGLYSTIVAAGLVPQYATWVPDSAKLPEVDLYSWDENVLVVPQPPTVQTYVDSVNALYAPKVAKATGAKKAEPGKPAEASKAAKSKTDFSKIM